jgi:hypothetical protein
MTTTPSAGEGQIIARLGAAPILTHKLPHARRPPAEGYDEGDGVNNKLNALNPNAGLQKWT